MIRTIKLWAAKIAILFFAMAPASCHYLYTGPALWGHQSSYAFEAWLLMWVASIILVAGAVWFAVLE